MCKSTKNQKSKIFTKTILSSTYIEESRKGEIEVMRFVKNAVYWKMFTRFLKNLFIAKDLL